MVESATGEFATSGPAGSGVGPPAGQPPAPPHRVALLRVFSSAPDARRVRRATDVLLLVVAILFLAALAVAGPGPTSLDTSLVAVLDSISGVAGWLWELSYALLVLWAVVIIVASLVSRGRRRLLLDYLTAAVLALGAAVLASLLEGTSPTDTLHALLSASPPAVYLAVRIAIVTAVVLTASPHLSRSVRYVSRAIIALGAVAGVALGVALPIGIAAGFAVGVAAAAMTHLLLGSPDGRPTADQVALALGDLGVAAVDVRDADRQVSGVARFTATTAQGDHLLIKVFGRDAWDARFLASSWTAVKTRGERPQIGTTRRQRVEHEAVVTLLAERAGVPVMPVVAVGRSVDGDALLVTQASGTPLSRTDALDDTQLARTWAALIGLHGAGIAHGSIDADHVVLRADGSPALVGMGEGDIVADHDDLMVDQARLLVTLALIVGQDRAVASAMSALGGPGLAEVLPAVQPAVLDHVTAAQVKDGEWSMKDLHAAAVAASGVDPLPLQRIQRVTIRSLLMVVLIGLLTYFVISKLADVDLASIWDELKGADWWYLLAALLVSPIVQMSFAFSTLGASTARLRYVPVLMLQYAIQFIALVLPATAARLALEIRFFERFGLAAAAALSIGVIDSGSGFLVQIALILLISLSSLPGLTSSATAASTSTSTTASSGPSTALLVLGLVVLGVVVTLVVPTLRHRVFSFIPRVKGIVREQAASAREALTVLRHPRKVGQMLLGNLGAQLLQALILGLCLQAFGHTAQFSQLILINTFVSLFAGLMPVPGGMGVAEAGYTAGLQAIGIPSAVAISTAIAFRLVTFYLPPLWGSLAMRWLRRRSYV